ncbi:hypothetical protein VOLCADRAFT_81593 [Volvox carteri f. nagariensis]|uniref:DUF2232 domain-containing protein n=1 Tax=Volvox carteri f. nagariensis TaxID=3068 RepID=D8TZE1_VOLCA|nr:uncharacterized protein VOLCADRAFT_81593 [Volvox carteri f. nagariensis]EFJ47259.1 hypothetical protein VOLCADRAFT_81593 [Volvox carteri f. nagariensis]|eukprot:XP_002951808.1 hypothetical protein VOLCADRAFT_81593 [Volvox carteri f. nagariensis]
MASAACPLSRCSPCPLSQPSTKSRLKHPRPPFPVPFARAFPSSCATCTARVGASATEPNRKAETAALVIPRTRRGGRCMRNEGRRFRLVPTASSQPEGDVTSSGVPCPSTPCGADRESSYTLEDTRTLVETAMLAAVSGLAYMLSTILKLENSLGYFLPLPVVLSALRSGGGAGWRTMTATCFLLVVLLGPLRAMSYLFLHGLLAATLGSLWSSRVGFWPGVVAGALVRMCGQLSYLVMSSVTMNENMFALLLSNVYNMLDQASAALGLSGAPSPLAVNCTISSLLLINGLTYCFLVHVVYRVLLGTMGYQLGPLPGLVAKYVNAGVVER